MNSGRNHRHGSIRLLFKHSWTDLDEEFVVTLARWSKPSRAIDVTGAIAAACVRTLRNNRSKWICRAQDNVYTALCMFVTYFAKHAGISISDLRTFSKTGMYTHLDPHQLGNIVFNDYTFRDSELWGNIRSDIANTMIHIQQAMNSTFMCLEFKVSSWLHLCEVERTPLMLQVRKAQSKHGAATAMWSKPQFVEIIFNTDENICSKRIKKSGHRKKHKLSAKLRKSRKKVHRQMHHRRKHAPASRRHATRRRKTLSCRAEKREVPPPPVLPPPVLGCISPYIYKPAVDESGDVDIGVIPILQHDRIFDSTPCLPDFLEDFPWVKPNCSRAITISSQSPKHKSSAEVQLTAQVGATNPGAPQVAYCLHRRFAGLVYSKLG